MSYAEAALIILLTAIVAVVATGFARRALGLHARQQHHEVGNPVYLHGCAAAQCMLRATP
jgi:hypothetical protein